MACECVQVSKNLLDSSGDNVLLRTALQQFNAGAKLLMNVGDDDIKNEGEALAEYRRALELRREKQVADDVKAKKEDDMNAAEEEAGDDDIDDGDEDVEW
jgi:hypothetical protein